MSTVATGGRPVTQPHNKPTMDERRFRFILVNVFGSRSEEVEFYDDLMHRLWAAEGEHPQPSFEDGV